jgi:histone-lysine N-methyltransferase SETMAR
LLKTFKWDVLGHPSHSPDLAPSDYHVFGKLKDHIAGEKFDDDGETKDEVLKWLNEQAAEFYTQASRS